MKLLEVFKDFKVRVKGASFHSKYEADYLVIPKSNPKTVTLEDLNKYVESLQRRYPDRDFYLRITHVNGKQYHIITRKTWKKLPDGTKKRVYDRIPIYINLEEQKFYVPETYVRKQYGLTCYIIMRTLGTLGVAEVKYAGISRRKRS
jgi:hypothetical protein